MSQQLEAEWDDKIKIPEVFCGSPEDTFGFLEHPMPQDIDNDDLFLKELSWVIDVHSIGSLFCKLYFYLLIIIVGILYIIVSSSTVYGLSAVSHGTSTGMLQAHAFLSRVFGLTRTV
jgi:hypothetical protein